MDAVIDVDAVEEGQTRSGKTRFVVRASDGKEYTTFRERIGAEAKKHEGGRARIEFHEEERNGFQNVYLDKIEAAPEEEPGGAGESADEVGWKAAIEAAPWLLGSDHPTKEVPPDELFDKLQPFKEKVADDIDEDGG